VRLVTERRATSTFLTFDNRNLAVDRKILEALSFTNQQQPFYLKTIDSLALSQTQDDSRVVIGKVAASADFHLIAPQISGLECASGRELYFLHNSRRCSFLATLLATLSSIFRSRAALELENLALRHQIGVLRRSARKRPKLTSLSIVKSQNAFEMKKIWTGL
jgi:hypothetical protein